MGQVMGSTNSTFVSPYALCAQSQVTELLETCLQCLIKDNQSSVKVMIEWVVVRILLDYPSTVGRFWEEIKAVRVYESVRRHEIYTI